MLNVKKNPKNAASQAFQLIWMFWSLEPVFTKPNTSDSENVRSEKTNQDFFPII